MPKVRKPAMPPKKPSAMELMIQECVRKAKARKRSGQTDQEWRQQYAGSLKTEDGDAPALSQTPFDGDTSVKKRG